MEVNKKKEVIEKIENFFKKKGDDKKKRRFLMIVLTAVWLTVVYLFKMGLWFCGWIFMPRMTIGILLCKFTTHGLLGIFLIVIGALLDIGHAQKHK